MFRTEVELRAGLAFQPLRPYAFGSRGDRVGWVEGIDDKHCLALSIPSSGLVDKPDKPLKSGLAAIVAVHTDDLCLTPNQNIIIAGVSGRNRTQIDALTQRYSLINDTVSPQRKSAMACVSYPTCSLVIAEAERVLPDIVDRLDAILMRNGIAGRGMTFRATGCPNGCSQAMLAEIGLVDRAVGHYDIYLGDNHERMRIPRPYKENQPLEKIIRDLNTLLSAQAQADNPDETFSGFATQTGIICPILNSSIGLYLQD